MGDVFRSVVSEGLGAAVKDFNDSAIRLEVAPETVLFAVVDRADIVGTSRDGLKALEAIFDGI